MTEKNIEGQYKMFEQQNFPREAYNRMLVASKARSAGKITREQLDAARTEYSAAIKAVRARFDSGERAIHGEPSSRTKRFDREYADYRHVESKIH
jgi:hypothetical protein